LLIGRIDILPALFERIIVPSAVMHELRHPKAPPVVRQWMTSLPDWVDVRQTASGHMHDAALENLDAGEEEAIVLAMELHADVLLMDDQEGVAVARNKGFEVIGTLGILGRAAQRQLLDLADAFDRLKRTNFHCRQEIMDQYLAEVSRTKR